MMAVAVRAERPPLPEPTHATGRTLDGLVRRAWQQDAERRPTAEQLRVELRDEMTAALLPLGPAVGDALASAPATASARDTASAPASASTTAALREPPPPVECDVFLSLQPGEADAEASELKRALEGHGLRVFDPRLILDLGRSGMWPIDTMYAALSAAKVVVLLATEGFGRRCGVGFGTYEQFQLTMDEAQHKAFLVKMCERWAEPHVRGQLGGRMMFALWLPGTPMPSSLVMEVMSKLGGLAAPQQRV